MAAKKNNMEFFFTILSKSQEEIAILMYSTEYRLVKIGDQWQNKIDNSRTMSAELVSAVIKTVFPAE